MEQARQAMLSQARVSSLIAELEQHSHNLAAVVQRTPLDQSEEESYHLELARGSHLSLLESELGALLFHHEEESKKEGEGEEEGREVSFEDIKRLPPDEMAKSKNVGARRCQRLLQSYEHFTSEQEQAFRRKLSKLRARSGLDKLLGAVASRERARDQLIFELRSKQELLQLANARKDDDCAPDSDAASTKSLSLSQREMERLLQAVAATQGEIAQCLQQHGQGLAVLEVLQEQLNTLLFDSVNSARPAASQAAVSLSLPSQNKGKASRLKNKRRRGWQQPTQAELADESFADVNALLVEGCAVSGQLAEAESSITMLRETLAVQQRNDACKELGRLTRACANLEAQISRDEERAKQLELSVLGAGRGLDSWEGRQAVKRWGQRRDRRQEAQRLVRERRILARLPQPAPTPILLPQRVHLHHLPAADLAVAVQGASILKAQLALSDEPGGAPRILTSALLPDAGAEASSRHEVVAPAAPATQVPSVYLKAMRSVSADHPRLPDPRQDFGLCAVLEQLQTLEGMLLSATRRKFAHDSSSSGGLQGIRDQLSDAKASIVATYKALATTETSMRQLASETGASAEERDQVRQEFLSLIAGRDEMPLTITARQDEVTSLAARLIESRQELDGLKAAVRAKRAELAAAQDLHARLKNTPALAEAAAAEAARAAIDVVVKQPQPAAPLPPGVVLTSPPTCVPREQLRPTVKEERKGADDTKNPTGKAKDKDRAEEPSLPAPAPTIRIPRVEQSEPTSPPAPAPAPAPTAHAHAHVHPHVHPHAPAQPHHLPHPHPHHHHHHHAHPQPHTHAHTAHSHTHTHAHSTAHAPGPTVTSEPSSSGYPVYFYKPRSPRLATTPRQLLQGREKEAIAVQTLTLSLPKKTS